MKYFILFCIACVAQATNLELIELEYSTPQDLNPSANAFEVDRNGDLWFISAFNPTIAGYIDNSWEILRLQSEFEEIEELAFDMENNPVIADRNRIAKITESGLEFVQLDPIPELYERKVFDLEYSNDNSLWVCSLIFQFSDQNNPVTSEIIRVSETDTTIWRSFAEENETLSNGVNILDFTTFFTAFDIDNQGNIWAFGYPDVELIDGTFNISPSLAYFENDKWNPLTIDYPNSTNSITSFGIAGIAFDDNDNLWVATGYNSDDGGNKYSPGYDGVFFKYDFNTWKAFYDSRLPGGNIPEEFFEIDGRSFGCTDIEYYNGNIWISTFFHQIIQVNDNDNLHQYVLIENVEDFTIGTWNIAADNKGSLWVTNWFAEIFRFNLVVSSVENENQNIMLYPNPAFDKITINTFERDLEIIDINGNSIETNIAYSVETATIDISNLSRGTYFVRLKNSIEKFVVR